ncbi:hypothetical protein BU26DRAFT_504240 [Trematosphaeria pertusa]|uniref:Uncharacterized protein n=1 Tax=Trematosphaeria pertusa TaxID=390896 RepID=A0A6A6IHE6_9PLEO|nr:uncharacterized protein BU26DRAFT_504240 [Trematosphaeria pertusa]KAF2249806.1 hypothetical protein BU26DRAFT_504240 [Trematosphaeria pertusa]
MSPNAHLLDLPRELRDKIYADYLSEDGGYLFNFERGRLGTAEHQPINLSLMYTCRQVATEMRGLALGANAVTFTTGYSNRTRADAGQFDHYLDQVRRFKNSLLSSAHPCVTAEAIEHTARHHGEFLPVLRRLQAEGWTHDLIGNNGGLAPSRERHFVASTLAELSKHPDFTAILSQDNGLLWGTDETPNLNEIVSCNPLPWAIPTKDDIAKLSQAVSNPTPLAGECWERQKYRYSAAALAINFLASLPPHVRVQFRTLILREDRMAVGYPECHAQGLIPFCRENPRLRITQTVNLWRNAFPKGSKPLRIVLNPASVLARRYQYNKLNAHGVTDSVALWIMEAVALPSFGMPPGSLTVILDGDPIPSETVHVFDRVLRDAAWQSALDECYARKHIPSPSWFERRSHKCYRFEGFPAALDDIVKGRSFIRCNFNPGDVWDVERLVEANRNWSAKEWARQWIDHRPRTFETTVPLPSWLELRREDALPE